MSGKKAPRQQLGGTRKATFLYSRAERARREADVVQKLEQLSETNPEKFSELLKLLAKLVVETEHEEK